MKNQNKNTLRYSQNFLKSQALVERLINLSSISREDVVYEIGHGKGIITQLLAKREVKVIGIEKDKKLCEALKKKFSGNSKVEIRCGDFLKTRLPEQGKYKVFSNIPFNLTAKIIGKLTSAPNPPEDCYLVVQKEAAEKFTGFPKETQYTLLLKSWFELRIIYHFQRTDFFPVPKVNVVLLRIKKHQEPLVKEKEVSLYRDFIIYGFNQWKPTLKKTFKEVFTYHQWKKLARDLKFALRAIPTELDFNQWLGLFNFFLIEVPENKKQLVLGAEKRLKRQQTRLQKVHRTRIK